MGNLPIQLPSNLFNLHGQESMSCTAGDVSSQSMPNHSKKSTSLLSLQSTEDMTVEDWKNVVWSDEMKINFFGPDGKQFCWIKNAGFNSKLVRPTVKFGSSSIMIWGCMTWEGVGDLWLQHAYTNITFQQDNDLKHMSKKTTTCMIAKSRDELLKRCEAEWTAITPETCRTLIESMPDCIKVVLKAKGGNMKY
ncbi:uncharacterized protein UHO2_00477 [Ustilago hordei]|uniref:uncharacterized protein n=1 Tax=Ustilago hordei TaxID=120017 RepID=UPI001A499166|nr:uncharacterized protein UHO2_00477 [Ustilago hordei]SYW81992.1 related to transposase [Ustilago hordei]